MYTISRFEETGEALFICLNSTNNPVYLEHFFTSEEKLDQEGTIARLIAELELLDEAYTPPTPTVSRLEEIKDVVISKKKISDAKEVIVAEKLAEKIEAEKVIEEKTIVEELI